MIDVALAERLHGHDNDNTPSLLRTLYHTLTLHSRSAWTWPCRCANSSVTPSLLTYSLLHTLYYIIFTTQRLDMAMSLRELVSEVVLSSPDEYSEAVLGIYVCGVCGCT